MATVLFRPRARCEGVHFISERSMTSGAFHLRCVLIQSRWIFVHQHRAFIGVAAMARLTVVVQTQAGCLTMKLNRSSDVALMSIYKRPSPNRCTSRGCPQFL